MDKYKKLKKLIDKYKNKFGIEHYFIDVYISDSKHVITNRSNDIEIKEGDYMAEVMNRDVMLEEFSISVDDKHIKGDIEDTICHEMLHVLFWKMTDIIENAIKVSNLDRDGRAKLYQEFIREEHAVIDRLIKELK